MRGLVEELSRDLGMNPELEFVDTEVTEVSEYRVTGTNTIVGRIIPSHV